MQAVGDPGHATASDTDASEALIEHVQRIAAEFQAQAMWRNC